MQSQILDVKPCNPVVKGFIGKVIGKINGKILSFYVSLKRLYDQFWKDLNQEQTHPFYQFLYGIYQRIDQSPIMWCSYQIQHKRLRSFYLFFSSK